jgi:peptidoglycan/LPS O-acetylase OafA/YrhL
MTTLRSAFDPKSNALNALRLVLATGVVIWHAAPLTGHNVGWAPAEQLFSGISVDGFFAISGFLILSSWVRRPHAATFLRARVLRIFPAFWVCLILTAVIIAPLSLLLAGKGMPATYAHSAQTYVWKNAALNIFQHGIAGTPSDVPYPGIWDGALWTLVWEFACYLGILALGVAGMIRYRATIPILFVLTVLGLLLTTVGVLDSFLAVNGARFGSMFLAGCMIYRYQNRIPLSWPLIAVAAVAILPTTLLPEYRLLAALPIAYVMIGAAALVKRERLTIGNDISYGVYIYGFPLQQLLAGTALVRIGVAPFAVVAMVVTVPVAAASWFLLEKPALRLKGNRVAQTAQEVAVMSA